MPGNPLPRVTTPGYNKMQHMVPSGIFPVSRNLEDHGFDRCT